MPLVTTQGFFSAPPKGQEEALCLRLPTYEELSKVYSYDPETGNIYKHNNLVGGRSRGYLIVWVGNQRFLAHRLAWMLMHKEWPVEEIDHINGCRTDNRYSNIRLATKAQNNANRPKHANNTSGFKGVFRNGARWMARIRIDHKPIYLGTFDTAEEASEVYRKAAVKYFGEFANAG